jgi:hypothetical protein
MNNKKPRRVSPRITKSSKDQDSLYRRIREILEFARSYVARSVNTTQVIANWLIGREIVEDELLGKKRAEYGETLIGDLAKRLTMEFGRGYSKNNLFWFRRLYVNYPELLFGIKVDAAPQISIASNIVDTARQIFEVSHRKLSDLNLTLSYLDWQPGRLNPNLSWTHYRTLLRVDNSIMEISVRCCSTSIILIGNAEPKATIPHSASFSVPIRMMPLSDICSAQTNPIRFLPAAINFTSPRKRNLWTS